MRDEDLILEDWKMTKDRIKHFDDVVIRLRLGGVPIASAIISAGLASFQYTSRVLFNFFGYSISGTSIIILLGAAYILPICVLDVFHFKLLTIAVGHARNIEQQDRFKGRLQVTTKLTSPILTKIHLIVALTIYIAIFVTAIGLAYAVNFL